jgi:hypothetical protein
LAEIQPGQPNAYQIFSLAAAPLTYPAFMTFDGTNMWVSSYQSGAVRMAKVFSGTGMGQTDLNTVVNLNPPGVCSGAANRSCVANIDCTGFGSGICNVTAQPGNFNIGGSATIGQGLTIGGDLDVTNNQWPGSDVSVPTTTIGTITADCPNGTYIKGIVVDGSGKLSGAGASILCRGL